MAESIKLKEILHLMKLRVLLYGWPCFSDVCKQVCVPT